MRTHDPRPYELDDIYPRDEEHRYRIYAVVGDHRTVLATADSAGGVGLALVQIHEDQKEIGRRLSDYGRIGVLDVLPGGEPHATGEWIVQPYDRRPA